MISKFFTWLGSFNDPNNKRNLEYRGDYYFNRIFFKRINSIYNQIQDQINSQQIDYSNQKFSPIEKISFGATYNAVQSLLGKHKFSYTNQNKENLIQVLFYRIAIDGFNSFVQFQFFNNQLYFLGIDNAKSMPSEKEKTLILNSLLKNILPAELTHSNQFKTIKDANGNYIYLNDEINFTICYLNQQFLQERENLNLGLNVSPN